MAAVPVLDEARFGYLKPTDIARLEEAYRFSGAAHAGQMRQSGEPYVSHPLAVAEILAGWHLDSQALMAALLHDVMEDTSVTKAEISDTFGKPVADLVDGVSKLDKIEFQSAEDAQAENFRKMLLAMARDVRVILIKLADRLHNMRTLAAVAPAKRRRVARETMEIYAPIANRLGLNELFHELQELAFSHTHPMRYRVLSKATRSARGNRREVVGKIEAAIKAKLAEAGIGASITGREKHIYSIYRKMIEKHLSFSEVHDIYGYRVVVRDIPTCYLALGALHGLYKPVPGKFKDYIAIPKANGYQSLHTALIGPYGVPVEIQLRTENMHRLAEAGVASHWMYKSDTDSLSELQKKTHQWLQSLLEIQSQSGDSQEFLEHVKVDLFPDEVYVFTPEGPHHVAAARRHRGGLRLRGAHRHRQQVRRGQGERRTGAAAHRAAQRRAHRNHHHRATPSPIRPGCSTCAPARRAPTSGISSRRCSTTSRPRSASACSSRRSRPTGTARRTSTRTAGRARCATPARIPGRSCWPTSAWAAACRRSWRGGCCATPSARRRRAGMPANPPAS